MKGAFFFEKKTCFFLCVYVQFRNSILIGSQRCRLQRSEISCLMDLKIVKFVVVVSSRIG